MWLKEWLASWSDFQVLFVGVYCPLSVLEQRERDRKDRTLGQARGQAGIIHQNCIYDLQVDTSQLSPEECARAIKTHLISGKMTAFERMR
jgi:chloramphenicol 3-O phosphotransferase